MALPTALTGIGGISSGRTFVTRPFISSAGNVYVFGRGSASTDLVAVKATDPTDSFSGVGTDVTFTEAINCVSGHQVGDIIHIATASADVASQADYHYHTFNMATDAWVITNETIELNVDTANAFSSQDRIHIGARSDGDIIVLYQGTKETVSFTDRTRVDFARREGGTWTTGISTEGDGTTSNWSFSDLVMGSSDRAHAFLRSSSTAGSYHQCMTSDNTVQTVSSAVTTDTRFNTQQTGAAYVSGGTTKVRAPYPVNSALAIDVVKIDSADTPTPTVDLDVTGATDYERNFRYECSLAADGTDLWLVFLNDIDEDLYTQVNEDDGGWSAPALFFAGANGACADIKTNVYERGGNNRLGIVFYDGSSPRYHEKDLGSAAPEGDADFTFGAMTTTADTTTFRTRLYLHDATNLQSGTFPTDSQATTPLIYDYTIQFATTLRTMDTEKGTENPFVARIGNSIATTDEQVGWCGYWTSPPLDGNQTITDAALNINCAMFETSLNMNIGAGFTAEIYVWRPSTGTKVGTISHDATFAGVAEPDAAFSEQVNHGSVTSSTEVAALDGDVIIAEFHQVHTQDDANSYSFHFYFDGGTVKIKTGDAANSHASFVEFAPAYNFKPEEITGTANFTFGAMTLTSEVEVIVEADSTFTFGAMTLDSAGPGGIIEADADFTFGAMTITSDGDVSLSVEADLTFGTMTITSDGTQGDVIGEANFTFEAMTTTSDGDTFIVGEANFTFGAMTITSVIMSEERMANLDKISLFASDYAPGTINDKLKKLLIANGATGTHIDDLWMDFLGDLGHTGTLKDRQRKFLLAYNAVADTGQTIDDLWSLIDGPYVP